MRDSEVSLTLHPSGRTVFVLEGTCLWEAATSAGDILETPCGGEGTCGKCRVKILSGDAPPSQIELAAFTPDEIRDGWRLACQTAVEGPMVALIPDESRAAAEHRILTESKSVAIVAAEPPVRKFFLDLPPRKNYSDIARLEAAVGASETALPCIRDIASKWRAMNCRGTAVVVEGRLIDCHPDDETGENWALAVDVGTTTLVAALIDATTGRETAVTACSNPQTRFGDDVISRIQFTRENANSERQLQEAVVQAINEMIDDLCISSGIRHDRIYAATFAGNTTMLHLLCGITPGNLGELPFSPTVDRSLSLSAEELGLRIHPHGRAYVFPAIGGFVGGDTVASILATNLTADPGPTLLIDIGTNGEIVLWADGHLTATSAAACPAFEGARISCGMRGCAGAIEKIVFDSDGLRYNVIDNVMPRGLCGSGLVDLIAELLRIGLLDRQGKLVDPAALPTNLHSDIGRRFLRLDQKTAFQIVPPEESVTQKPITVTQCDIREMQLAVGAIKAAIRVLLNRSNLDTKELKAVYLAGGFGNYIRRENARRIGLLPVEVPTSRIRYRGNTSLAGAKMAALSMQNREAAERIAQNTEHVDLSYEPAFQEIFAQSMEFPS